MAEARAPRQSVLGIPPQPQQWLPAESEGLEVDWRTPILHEKHAIVQPEDPPAATVSSPDRGRWRTRWIIACIFVVILVLVAVLVPVGLLVIGRKGASDKPNDPDSPSATPSSPTSTSLPTEDGILKGTRLSTMDPRTGGDIFVYYQYGDGSLRYISMSPTRVWQGSRSLPVDDAMIGTPLTATFTITNGSTTWWLFYVDKSNIIQNIFSRSNPTEWKQGNVGDKRYAVPAQSSIAFTTARGIRYDAKKPGLGGGLSLFASGTDGHMHEYLYNEDDESWTDGSTFASTNGYGGASVWSQNNLAYLFTLGNTQLIDLWWRDYNDTESQNNGDAWHLGPSSNAAVMANASMCGQYDFAYQAANGRIQGSNFTTLTKLDSMRWDTSYDISDGPAMENSAVSCWYFFPSDGRENTMFHVFYQAENGDIREARRYWEADNATVPGTWHYGKVPIT
ncbi:hypothetical protein FQN50_008806 [Emmonsiellopsis sp. PD_5]|nr:hypothetical protein FQN50_008806 [Emmonsiellopsis sp. PD_5]